MIVAPHAHTTAGKYETVEDLIRHAVAEFALARVPFPPAKLAKLIRRTVRSDGPDYARRVIEAYADREASRLDWHGFELHVNGGYVDPTGAHAAANVDRERGV